MQKNSSPTKLYLTSRVKREKVFLTFRSQASSEDREQRLKQDRYKVDKGQVMLIDPNWTPAMTVGRPIGTLRVPNQDMEMRKVGRVESYQEGSGPPGN